MVAVFAIDALDVGGEPQAQEIEEIRARHAAGFLDPGDVGGEVGEQRLVDEAVFAQVRVGGALHERFFVREVAGGDICEAGDQWQNRAAGAAGGGGVVDGVHGGEDGDVFAVHLGHADIERGGPFHDRHCRGLRERWRCATSPG